MNHTVPNWVARLLGINAEAGEGTVWSIECVWPWPPWATLLFVMFSAVFIATVYWREGQRDSSAFRVILTAVRLGLIGLVLLMIAQVTLVLQRTGLPYAAVLIDNSQSMTIVDHYPDRLGRRMAERLAQNGLDDTELSRWNLAQTLLTEHDSRLLRDIAEDHKLRVGFLADIPAQPSRDFEKTVKSIRSHTPSGESSRLGDGIRTILDELRGTTPAAIVLLTDGVNTGGPTLTEAAKYARRRGVPISFIGLGSERPVRDLKLSDLLVDDVVFVNDVVQFECKLTATDCEGQTASVVLREKGNPDVLAKVETTLGADGTSQAIRLPYRPTQVGLFEYVVEAEPQKGELQTENNRQTCTIEVRKEKIRVLLVQAYPSYEFRYLRNMLQRDETITLHTVLQDADLEYAEQDASALRAFPLQRDELFAYDVVILGDVNPSLLNATALQNLADFVNQPSKGGSLVLIAGPLYMPGAFRDTPLERLMPFAVEGVRYPDPNTVLTEGFAVQPTDLGLANPSMQLGDSPEETKRIWEKLPPLYWLLELPEVKPGVRVLAVHPTRVGPEGHHLPVFCLQYVGAGKVLFHATNETWRWRYRVGDVFFARYWIQTIRYLCRAKLAGADQSVSLDADRRTYTQGDPVRLRVRFLDERLAPVEDRGVTVVVERAGRRKRSIPMHRTAAGRGVFEGLLEQPESGSYHAWISAPVLKGPSPSADFLVEPPAGEFAQVRMDADTMRQAAKISGGRFYTFDTAGRLPRDLPPGHQVPIETLPPRPLWNRWPLLALFLGLLITEWIVRKWRGMV